MKLGPITCKIRWSSDSTYSQALKTIRKLILTPQSKLWRILVPKRWLFSPLRGSSPADQNMQRKQCVPTFGKIYEENMEIWGKLGTFLHAGLQEKKLWFRRSDQCFGTVGPSVRPYSISMPCLGLTFQGASICGGPRAWEGREWRLVKKLETRGFWWSGGWHVKKKYDFLS